MSNRVSFRASRNLIAMVALTIAAGGLSGCSSLGSMVDTTTTSSIGSRPISSSTDQSMPQPIQVASNEARYVPPADIGGGSSLNSSSMPISTTPQSGVVSNDLPSLSSTSGSTQTMPAQLSTQPAASPVAPAPAVVASPSATPEGFTHVIESGESLYTIARKYNVTTGAIVSANGLGSPDKIFVGQKIVIPGVKAAPQMVASAPKVQQPAANDVSADATTVASTPAAQPVMQETVAQQPTQVASVQPTKPAGPAGFRWPLSGKVITDFAASKGTGINIAANEGAAVRATDSGTVIYVGSAVEGYGNLILIKHSNGYVSAYAHLSQITVTKGDEVMRGDAIGLAGSTGSVSSPQLHFELRKGATPVDPVPLLAS